MSRARRWRSRTRRRLPLRDAPAGRRGLRVFLGPLVAATALIAIPLARTAAAGTSPAGVRVTEAGEGRGGVPARIVGPFLMSGHIDVAVNVQGEQPGQTLQRGWTFLSLACQGSTCRWLVLTRQRGGGHVNRLILARNRAGNYSGWSVFYEALSCKGRVYKLGEVAPYTISVQVTHTLSIEGIAFATGLSATYANRARVDRTPCPLGPSHDAAHYAGIVRFLPSPPATSFSVSTSPTGEGAAFADTSTPGRGGAPVVAWSWQFGDPSSGSADSSSDPQPIHTFSAPGSYVVTLTVLDANGLRSTSIRTVKVPRTSSLYGSG